MTQVDVVACDRRHGSDLRRLCRWIDWVAMGILVGHIAVATSVFGQSQETINERQRLITDNVAYRLALLEAQNLSGRVAVLESDMYEVKWLARGVALAVMGQLIMAGLGLRESRRRGQ